MPTEAGDGQDAGRKVRQKNVSLFPTEYAALELLAKEERNHNASAAVARMIDTAMTDRYGDDWRNQAPLDRRSSDDRSKVA